MLPPFARALAVAACLLPLALPSAAAAQLSISHVKADAVELDGNLDDVVTPGDRIRIDERIATATGLTNATGTLMSPTPGVTVNANTSPYPDTAAGGQAGNTRAFEANLADAGSLPCGTLLQFTLSMSATAGVGSTSFSVPTGAEGPSDPYVAAAGARPLADATEIDGVVTPGVTNLEMGIMQTGRVKTLTVTVGSLSHPRLADLRLTLVAPEGQEVVLAEAGDLGGTQITDAVFAAAAGTSITSGAAPYTGTFRPRGSLAGLEGRLLNGTWTLKATDTVTGEAGSLDGWRVDASRAFCSGIPKARFTMTQNGQQVIETLPGGTIDFDASTSTDNGGAITEYRWDLDGDGEYDDGTTPQVSRTYPVKAKVPVRLRVRDSDGLYDVEHKDLPVTVKPVAAISSSPTDPAPQTSETVRLSAAGSVDGDGSIVRFEWDKDGFSGWTDTQGTDFVDVQYAQAGTYTAYVRITDDTGSQDTETVEVVVRDRPPTAVIDEPGLIVRDQVATLAATGSSDPEGSTLEYQWNFGGTVVDSGTSPTVEHTFTTAGFHTVGLTVRDNRGSTDTTTRQVLVTRAPTVAVTATPNPVSLRDPVTFDATDAQDPDDPSSPLAYAWDLDADAAFDDGTAATATAPGWATAGTYVVKVRVTDASGAATVAPVSVIVRNMIPLAAISASPATPKVGQVTQLSAAAATDPDGTIARYQWDLDGDGFHERDTGTTASTSASFANHGNVTVGLRLTDDDGGTGTKTLTISVQRADPPPDPTGGNGSATGGDAPVSPATSPDGGPGGGDPQAPGGDAPGDGGDVPPGTDPARPFGAWLGGAAMQRTKHVLARGVLLSCRSELQAWCSLTVTVAAKDAKRLKLGRRAVTVAKSALPVPAGRSARKRLKLSAKARRALRGANGLRLLVRATVRSGDGDEVALSRVVLLRR